MYQEALDFLAVEGGKKDKGRADSRSKCCEITTVANQDRDAVGGDSRDAAVQSSEQVLQETTTVANQIGHGRWGQQGRGRADFGASVARGNRLTAFRLGCPSVKSTGDVRSSPRWLHHDRRWGMDDCDSLWNYMDGVEEEKHVKEEENKTVGKI